MNNYIKFLNAYGLQTVYSKSSLTQDSTETTESFTFSSNNAYNTSTGLAPIAQRKNQIETMYKTGTYGTQYIRKLNLDGGTTTESSYGTAGTWKYKNVNNVMFMFSYYTVSYNPTNYAWYKIENSYTQMTFTFYDVKYYKGTYYFFTGTDIVTSTDLITFTNHSLNLSTSSIKTFDVLQDKIYLFRTASSKLYVDIYDLTFTFIETKTIMSNGYYMWYAEHLEENNYIYASIFGSSQMKIIRYNISDNTYDLTTLYVLGSTSNETIGAHYYDTVVNYATKTYSVYRSKNGVTVDSEFNESLIEPQDNANNYIYEAVVKYMKVDITGRATLHDENTYNNLNGYKYKTVDSSAFTFRIKPNTNYKIDQVTSTIAGVSIVQDGQDYLVTYPDVYYQEDTLDVETSFAISLEPKGYKVKDTYTLTETFTSLDTTNDNFAVVEDNGENKIAPFKAIRFISDNVELKVNDEWVSFDKILYLGVSEDIFGITNEFLTIFNKNYYYFYKGITSEYTVNLENLNVTLSGQYTDVIHIDYDLESDSEVDYYVAFMTNSSSKLVFNINVDEGYKIVSLETNVGTYTTLFGYRVEVTQSEMVDNLNAQFNILLDADDIEIIFYKNTSDVNKKNKNLTNPYSQLCNMTEATSVESPSIVVEMSLLPPDYNYCYIPKFKRYYFIVSRINVGFKLWRFNLEVDTLKTASSALDNKTAYVLRSSSTYDNGIEDELLPRYSRRNFRELTCTNYKTFNFTSAISYRYIIALRSIKQVTMLVSGTEIGYTPPFITIGAKKDVNGTLTLIADDSMADNTDLIISVRNYNALTEWVDNNSLQSYIKYVMVIPESTSDLFEFYNNDLTANVSIKFDDNHTYTRSDIKVVKSLPRKVLYTTCDTSGLTKELYRDDYKLNVYLPFFGMTDIDKNKVGSSLDIYYYMDITNGIANVSVESGNQVILAQQCNLGIKIAVGIDNENEINKQREMLQTQQTTNNITSAITMIGSIASLVAGVALSATGVGAGIGAGAIIGGVAGIAGGTSSLVSKNITTEKQISNLYTSASSILGSGNSTLYLPNTVKVYVVEPIEIIIDTTDYINRFGKPLKQFVQIGTLSGFVQVGDIDLSNLDLTLSEIQKLREILYKGFYM